MQSKVVSRGPVARLAPFGGIRERTVPRATSIVFSRKRMNEAVRRASLVFMLGAGFGLAAGFPLQARAQSTPYSTAIAVPGTIEAENFDRGGEGVAYHDNKAGNSGNKYRTSEDVDLITSRDSAGGGYVVNNFETGEWLAYTINVATTGYYDIDLRASSTFANSAFHLQIDGQDVTGPVNVPNTGKWNTFQWAGKKSVALVAGKHILKVFANQQYFNLNSIRIRAAAAAPAPTPYSGTPISLPNAFEAENFDKGGQGVAYNDKVSGNAGGQYRTSEDVDIIVSTDTAGGYAVNNFETGEWLTYTVNVATAGQYDIAVRAASMMNGGAFHAEVNGSNVTGSVVVPNTGSWNTFQWVTKQGVTLAAGTQVLKLVADQQYFNVNSIQVTQAGTAPAPAPAPAPTSPDTSNRQFFCTFANAPTDCGFYVQQKEAGRATIVSNGRDGGTAVRLHTEPGDNNVAGSGSENERNDLSLSSSATDCSEGKEAWWAHSVLFPSDYNAPPSGYGVVMDFHHTGGTGQANFHVDSDRWDGKMHLRGYGGSQDANHYEVVLGPITKNVWYDFVYNVRWSSGSGGFMKAWLNGQKVLDHQGPTLYAGMGCYLKLANYHTAFGEPSSIIHDRVIRGSTPASVSLTPLEGVNQ